MRLSDGKLAWMIIRGTFFLLGSLFMIGCAQDLSLKRVDTVTKTPLSFKTNENEQSNTSSEEKREPPGPEVRQGQADKPTGPDNKKEIIVSSEDQLENSDCEKCHDQQPAEVVANGGKHNTSVSCLECHLEHPPLGTQTIPECSMCHGGDSHYELENCLGCHANPHTPLLFSIDDTPESTVGCLSCHGSKGEEFKKFPGKHAEKSCTFCHPKEHKAIKKCGECHKGHADTMRYEDCLGCHKPHQPLEITYNNDTPSNMCGSCHNELYNMLMNNPSKHRTLTCAICHKGRHPSIPSCKDCHENPHAAGLLTGFPDCLKCHNNPHDLFGVKGR